MEVSQMLYIVRGLPGSGKTTLAHRLAEVVCEADHYMVDEAGEYQFDAKRLKECHDACFKACEAGLRSGANVAVANTFTRRWEFERYVELAQLLEVPYQVIACEGSWGSVHDVPYSTIRAMMLRWEG